MRTIYRVYLPSTVYTQLFDTLGPRVSSIYLTTTPLTLFLKINFRESSPRVNNNGPGLVSLVGSQTSFELEFLFFYRLQLDMSLFDRP